MSQAHLKLTILDIYRAEMALDGSAYICKFYNTGEDRPIVFHNCRVSGVVTAALNTTTFALDDGTGVIPVVAPADHKEALPQVGTYVEVLGSITGNISRSITLLCARERQDPMEEVKRLMEQAAIHRDSLRFRKEVSERFLSSETDESGQFEKFIEAVNDRFMKSDPDKGLSLEEIRATCGGDGEIAEKVIHELQNNGVTYREGDTFFLL